MPEYDHYNYDPEAVIQDADILQAQWEAEGRALKAERKAGICSHTGSQLGHKSPAFYTADDIANMRAQGYFPDRPSQITGDQSTIPVGKCLCTECGELVHDDFADL